MGVSGATVIADKLMADGLSPETPCAVLERGTLPGGRALRTIVADLGATVVSMSVKSPALLIVGDVAALGVADDVLHRAVAHAGVAHESVEPI